MQDGDLIEIDFDQQSLTLKISEEELKQRLEHFIPLRKESFSELLDCYSGLVGPASEGAVWRINPQD